MDLRERDGEGQRRHPWEIVRSRFFIDLLARHGALDSAAAWLDVGAGDAWFGEQLSGRLPPGSSVTGWDINYTDKDLTAGAAAGKVKLTATRPTGSFGGVLLLDVIEHVADDQAFVADVVGGLTAPGGWVVVSVPAYQSLFSDHDRFLGHYRRYRPRKCRELLEGAGVEILASGGLFHSLLAARTVGVSKERVTRRPRTEQGIGGWSAGPAVTTAVTSLLSAEARLSLALAHRGPRLPGLSTWLLGRSTFP